MVHENGETNENENEYMDATVEQEQLNQLERVLLRFGLAEDTRICDILKLLLPQLFLRLVQTQSISISTKVCI